MNVSDFIIKFLINRGLEELFIITGGHSMHLNDAVAKSKLRYTCAHHEQALAMAAEAYGRTKGTPGVALVTAGPGSVNALTGVVGAWVDSAPLIVISGQSNLPLLEYQEKSQIRQYGVQGIAIKDIVTPVTKYFVTATAPEKIMEYMDRIWTEVTTGRPGPVWIEVPLDVQRASVPEEVIAQLATYQPKKNSEMTFSSEKIDGQVKEFIELIAESKRPLLIVGQGVRLAGAEDAFRSTLERLRIPLLTSRLGIDLIESDHPLYIGRPGTYGERSANFAVQNCDLLISVGSRLTVSLTGYNVKDFGRNAKKVLVDIDIKELDKPDMNPVLKIHGDAKVFFDKLGEELARIEIIERPEWLAVAQGWKKNYPVVLPEYKDEKPVSSYYFTDKLSNAAAPGDYILVDTGSCFHVACQTWKIKKGQRFLTTGGISTMGYWAAAIGMCVARERKTTIVITGDGSLQMNLQELATVKLNNLPLKIFIFNNNGYLLMRITQRNFMENRFIGEGPSSGVWCPDALEIAKAYGIKGLRISSADEVESKIAEALAHDGPVICDVMTPEWQLIIPRVASEKMPDGKMVSKPYEDMFPYLPPDELKKNMIA